MRMKVCETLLSELHRDGELRQWTSLEIHQVCHMVTPALLLRGFGTPKSDGRDPSMVLILQPYHPGPTPLSGRMIPNGMSTEPISGIRRSVLKAAYDLTPHGYRGLFRPNTLCPAQPVAP